MCLNQLCTAGSSWKQNLMKEETESEVYANSQLVADHRRRRRRYPHEHLLLGDCWLFRSTRWIASRCNYSPSNPVLFKHGDARVTPLFQYSDELCSNTLLVCLFEESRYLRVFTGREYCTEIFDCKYLPSLMSLGLAWWLSVDCVFHGLDDGMHVMHNNES